MTRTEYLKDLGKISCFYVQQGDWYRINSLDEDGLYVENEDTGWELRIAWEDIDDKKDCFYRLERVSIDIPATEDLDHV